MARVQRGLVALLCLMGVIAAIVFLPDRSDGVDKDRAAPPADDTPHGDDKQGNGAKPGRKPHVHPGNAILLLSADVGLRGTLDEQLVFHGEELVTMGPVHSGPPLLDREDVRRIIWPQGVDPKTYERK